MAPTSLPDKQVLFAINGIPEELHVPDLRTFFATAIERSFFSCFHYRRRCTGGGRKGFSCVLRVDGPDKASQFLKSFHGVPWKEVLIDSPIARGARCSIQQLSTNEHVPSSWQQELRPPPALPHGNVGTPRSEILQAIRMCRLPPSVVPRLGIVAPASMPRSVRGFATVPPPRCWSLPSVASDTSGGFDLDAPKADAVSLTEAGAPPPTAPAESPPAEDACILDAPPQMPPLTQAAETTAHQDDSDSPKSPSGNSVFMQRRKVPVGQRGKVSVPEPGQMLPKKQQPSASRLLAARLSPPAARQTSRDNPMAQEVCKHPPRKRRRTSGRIAAGYSSDHDSSGSESVERRHVPAALDSEPDPFDEPLEQAPHYERTDRLDSAAGYLYEDKVEHVWDKQDASGLVWYTDAAFWDQMAGDLDERAHDSWDVQAEDSDGSVSSWHSEEDERSTRSCRRKLHGINQSDGLAAVRRGAAGRMMRKWGGHCSATPSATLLAVVEGLQPNYVKGGIGFVGASRNYTNNHRNRKADSNCKDATWVTIGSAFDRTGGCDDEMTGRRPPQGPTGRVAGSFNPDPGGMAADRRRRIAFVPASSHG